MNLINKIDEKYKTSIKEKDSNSINTLRLVRSAIKDKQISIRGKQENLSDGDVLSLLQNMVKQRKDSIEAFEKANRQDLIDKEKAEIAKTQSVNKEMLLKPSYLSKRVKKKLKKLL